VDRNATVGFILITIILLVWMVWMSPVPPQQAPILQDDPILDTLAVEPAPQAPLLRSQPTTPVDTLLFGAAEGEERLITVENDLFHARFSTRGATLVSFVLKEYNKFDQVTPVQMVDTTHAGSIGLAFTTPAAHVIDTRGFIFDADFEGEVLRVGETAATLSFTSAVGAGGIRKTYTFSPETYEVGLEIEYLNPSAFMTPSGYEIVWFGAVPWTEGDHEIEARASGAFVRHGGTVTGIDLQRERVQERRFTGQIDWGAVKNKYFTAVIMPEVSPRGAEVVGERTGELAMAEMIQDFQVRLQMAAVQEGQVDQFRLYIGPMEYYRISRYNLGIYDMVDFGWNMFEWMTRPLAAFIFIPVFTFLSSFIPNYGIVIVIFAILMKVVLYPLTKSSYKNMARMRELGPKMEAIKEKYPDDPQKQQAAMMKMYKETGVNPLGGCLPMLLQWPILIALWMFLPAAIEIRQQSFLWASDLSAPDPILMLPFTIPLYGNFVAGFTLLMGLSLVVQMRVQMQPSTNPQAKIFMYVLPVMLFLFFNRMASGLSLYYLIFNVVSAVQQQWINKGLEKKGIVARTNGQDEKKEKGPRSAPKQKKPLPVEEVETQPKKRRRR
jgi:YidC/Oxa1 family membrane protein insertase